jgi:hypothetical protein
MKGRSPRQRFYVEVILGLAGLVLFAVNLAWNEWIEIVFRVDPDAGDGSLEYLVCFALLAGAACSAWLARTEWRRLTAEDLTSSRRAD